MLNTTLRTVSYGGLRNAEVNLTLEDLNSAEVKRLIPTIVFQLIICIFGITGNGLVIHVYRKRFKMSNIKCFILCLSVVDLLTCCIALPLDISTILKQYNFENLWLCKISRTLSTLGSISSSFILLCIAVDRFRKVCKPFGWQLEIKFAKSLCGLAILLGVLASFPAIFVYGKKTFDIPGYNLTGTECSTSDDMLYTKFPFVYSLVFGFLFIGGILAMSILYCLIGQEVRKHTRKMIKGKSSVAMTSPKSDERDPLRGTEIDPERSARYEVANTKSDRLQKEEISNRNELDSDESGTCKKDSEFSYTNSTEFQEQEYTKEKLETPQNLDTHILRKEKDNASESDGKEIKISLKTDVYRGIRINNINELNKNKEGKEILVEEIGKKEFKTGSKASRREENVLEQNKIMHHFSSVSIRVSNLVSRMTPAVKSETGPKRKSHSRKQARAERTAFIMFIVTLSFSISFLPNLLLMLVRQTNSEFVADLSDTGKAVYKFFLRTFFLNAAVNPIIYSIFDSRFKSACKGIFRR